ncbi:MAG TPA: hypothetical protein VFF95_16010 [Candidatus Binatus sp.]|nr:hypothetical protein [Candidatus Binatus sp.]
MKKIAALTLSLFLTYGTAFADTPKDTPKDADAQPAKPATPAKAKAAKKADKSDSAIAAEIEELRQTLQAQQEQLSLLKEELAKRDRQIDEARDAAAAANARAAEASTKATEAVNTTAEVKSNEATLNTTVANLKSSNEALKTSVATAQADAKKEDEPPAIRYKGITITPGGFFAAETVFRNRATSADVNTPFTGIPFEAADLAHVSENNFTARQSRVSMLAQGKVGPATLTGYLEADFLGAGTTSNNRQSNSYVFRQRQLFAQAAFENGWIITGGQQWTLATEDKKDILNRQEDLPLVIDPQYNVGFTWARQYGFRVVKDFGGKFDVGFAVEAPQATIGGRGFSAVTTINSAAAPATIVTSGATTATTGNFFLNAPGASPGLYNAFDATGYTVNKAPDLIFKATADPGFGHYEVFGIVSFFRDRIYPCGVVGTTLGDTVPGTATLTGNCTSPTPTVVSSFGASNSSSTGGGGGVSALFPLFNKHLDAGIKGVAGDGIGRYGSAQLADATARPDGTLALIRTAHGLARLEFHATPKLDIYAYYGLEYAWRAGYSGYDSVTITKTTAIPATATSPAIPATTHTVISTTGIGGYGNVAANNSGCATEGVPLNDFNPSAGANCAGDIRNIQEGTLGFWYRFYQGSKGRFQFGVQYSYITKSAWSGTGGVPAGGTAISPKGIDNMVFTSFRYYLP